ncbi:MAG: hypothetical protein Q8P92_05600 [Candidatus Daviesbacteria bacterium]|nr:hypothetical protein [Candidatus Daviesbacteria bacterium]
MTQHKERLLEADGAFRRELVELDQLKAVEESQRTLGLLEQAVAEFKTKPHTPEVVTEYWRTRWSVLGSKVGLKIEVPDSPYHRDEIVDMEHLQVPRAPIYMPSELTATPAGLILLGKMHPQMGSWVVKAGTPVKHTDSRGGWFDIESGWQTPYTGTNRKDLEELAKQNHWKGQRLTAYIIGSQNSKDLTGHYFDELGLDKAGWVRLLGSRRKGEVGGARFYSDGSLGVYWIWSLDTRYPYLGGRFEGVKKA